MAQPILRISIINAISKLVVIGIILKLCANYMNKITIFIAINDRIANLPDKSTTKVGFISKSQYSL